MITLSYRLLYIQSSGQHNASSAIVIQGIALGSRQLLVSLQLRPSSPRPHPSLCQTTADPALKVNVMHSVLGKIGYLFHLYNLIPVTIKK